MKRVSWGFEVSRNRVQHASASHLGSISSLCVNVTTASEQKMVDTLLTTDFLTSYYERAHHSLGVVSDDSDFVPPLMQVADKSVDRKVVLITSSDWDAELTALLTGAQVIVERMSL